ncbi:hypothetical protein KIW84_034242 [Lathyrus oleraceus]|uniref:Reverse transcriptase/retrotransposon-derived protein RNase H-like domain-containing protein n=1 Tax=Pisum sativum TaxID=3888 RepID=A0A9D4Y3H6_PEA|nr:hypothetical protein KIW84_034242 [Pisum sativum]
MTTTCAPIFKLLWKDQSCDWTEDCQKAFDSIKEYLLEPPILSPPVEGRPLIMYLTVLEVLVLMITSHGSWIKSYQVLNIGQNALKWAFWLEAHTSGSINRALVQKLCKEIHTPDNTTEELEFRISLSLTQSLHSQTASTAIEGIRSCGLSRDVVIVQRS